MHFQQKKLRYEKYHVKVLKSVLKNDKIRTEICIHKKTICMSEKEDRTCFISESILEHPR